MASAATASASATPVVDATKAGAKQLNNDRVVKSKSFSFAEVQDIS